MAGDWLADAVLYEIYPQSFADSDGDGVGDLRGSSTGELVARARERGPAAVAPCSGTAAPTPASRRPIRPALGGRASTRVVHAGYPFAYVRGETHLVVVNPRREAATLTAPEAAGAVPVLVSGVTATPGGLTVSGFSYGVFRLAGA